MKKILIILLCLGIVSMIYAGELFAHKVYLVPEDTKEDIKEEIKVLSEPYFPTAEVKSVGGPDDFGYEWIDSDELGGPVFNWIEISGTGTNMNLGDDEHFWSIPFSFTFYDNTYNEIAVGSNGTVYFEDWYLGLANNPIPDSSSYGVYVFTAPYWDDLNPSSAGSVYYQIIGDTLVVEWDSVPIYGTSKYLTFEVIMDGVTGDIVFQYLSMDTLGGSATVGIQGLPYQPPLWGLEYSYNTDALHDSLAIRFIAPPPPDHDVGVTSIDVPGSILDPFTTFTPTATFRNFGSNPETFNAYYRIDSAGTNVYTESVNLTLNPSDDSTHEFTDYTSGDGGVFYDIYAYTVLPGDENPWNDTTYKQSIVFELVNTLVSNWTTIPPTIDGVIDPVTEWGGAHVYDISDIYGYADGILNNPGDCILYLMNDSNNIYMAVDYIVDVTLTAYDQIGPYFDENNDNAWDTDSTEGNFWFYWDGSVDAIIYRSLLDGFYHYSTPGVSYARSLITNQQYEVSIPFGIDTTNIHYLYNTQFPDTFGFFIYALDQNTYDNGGYWPTGGANVSDPSTFGDLIITEWQAGIEDDEEIPAIYELSVNNLIASTNNIEIQYSLPEKSDLNIGVYDAMGRMIYSLKRNNVAAGWYNLSVREDITSGIYFIKMKAGKFEDVKKALILR